MTCRVEQVARNEPPQELISCITHLHNLLRYLPSMPYQQGVLESDPDLDDDQLMTVYLDCYPVHSGQGFQFWVYKKFPFIILCFVPVNCELNRIIKHRLKQSQMHFLVDSCQAQIAAGLTCQIFNVSSRSLRCNCRRNCGCLW